MIGTILNVAGIILGGTAGLLRRKPLSPTSESFFKVTLGAFTVFYGLQLSWLGIRGSLGHALKQTLIALLALMAGKQAGRLLRLQKISNRLGQHARECINSTRPTDPNRLSNGFKIWAVLLCAAPLGIVGAVQDGLSGYFQPLAIKAVMDGLATMGCVSLFGWGVMLAALPVLVLQGSITLVCSQLIEPFFRNHGLLELAHSVNAAGGLLIFSVALVMLQLKKIELADYLPSLAVAPLISWLWR